MTTQQTILTGITPSGVPHLGNFIGAIKPAIEAQSKETRNLYFIADWHSLVKQWDPALRQQSVLEVAASWLALGLDPNESIFYRQSHIPEIAELNWILTSVAAKGLLNRAHAYKDKVAANQAEAQDPDYGITLGLYNYPVLMAADILAFNANTVPVGKDQVQHLEIARDIAQRFNHIYQCNTLVLPETHVDEKSQTIPGLDGRKMSKSYNNTIPIFSSSKKLRKNIMKIVTTSQAPEEPKDPDSCSIFSIYRSIATTDQLNDFKKAYEQGIGWGDAKQQLFELLDLQLEAPRERYDALISNPKEIERILQTGEQHARATAATTLKKVKENCGLVAL